MTRRRTPRLLPLLLGLAAEMAEAAASCSGEAATARRAHRSQPAHIMQSSPDVTGTIAKPDADQLNASNAAAADRTEALKPYYLPDAPRARMRTCGETWQKKKMAGDTGDDDWRDFASKCLASTTPP